MKLGEEGGREEGGGERERGGEGGWMRCMYMYVGSIIILCRAAYPCGVPSEEDL